ncbi:MAG TPA: Hpt domain-containing protein [Burkholderiaceae bacterium]|nr:Hpt domain-containing protein [Burkholderiaceae bacterium]
MTNPHKHAGDRAAHLRGLPGVDVEAGLAFVGNSVEVYERLLNRFVQLHEADVNRLVVQAERDERSSVQRVAHSIKGGAATLGLSRLAGLAKELEQGAGENVPAARLAELARALRADHTALGRHLALASAIDAPEHRA